MPSKTKKNEVLNKRCGLETCKQEYISVNGKEHVLSKIVLISTKCIDSSILLFRFEAHTPMHLYIEGRALSLSNYNCTQCRCYLIP